MNTECSLCETANLTISITKVGAPKAGVTEPFSFQADFFFFSSVLSFTDIGCPARAKSVVYPYYLRYFECLLSPRSVAPFRAKDPIVLLLVWLPDKSRELRQFCYLIHISRKMYSYLPKVISMK